MENKSQSTVVVLAFGLWLISPPLSLVTSTGCVEGIGDLVRLHLGSPATSPGEGSRGDTITRDSYQQGQGMGPEGWMPRADIETGLCFHLLELQGADPSSHKHIRDSQISHLPREKYSLGPLDWLQTPASRRLAKIPKGILPPCPAGTAWSPRLEDRWPCGSRRGPSCSPPCSLV